jgi:hypothetical protein
MDGPPGPSPGKKGAHMTRFTRLTMLSAMAAGLVACGGGAKLGGGKEGAAQAAFQASQPAGRGGNTAQQLLDQALASGATSISISADCAKGGKASLVLDTNTIGQDGSFNYTVKYEACNEDGKSEYNGTMAISMRFSPDPSGSLAFVIGMKGKLTLEGEISDFIDADVRLTMDFTATSTRSGTVRLVADGFIKTSEGNHTYDSSQPLTISVGELPEA